MVSSRKAIERLYTGLCDIIDQQEIFDPETKQTSFESVTVAQAQPCRLSYSNISQAVQGNAAAIQQVIKLFLSPEVIVKAGARVDVTQNGRTPSYKAAGQPAIYSSHQEIILELAGDYA